MKNFQNMSKQNMKAKFKYHFLNRIISEYVKPEYDTASQLIQLT